jgi:tRNA dimethylallyltransferase
MIKKSIVVVTGATAVGKTAFAIKLATAFNTEIISADSRQLYKELNIGVAKPSPAELKQVKHHFINHVSIHDNYNAGKFETESLKLLAKLFAKHDVVVVCGGSGLYVDALCKGFDALPEHDENIRLQLKNLYEKEGIAALQRLLKEKDAVYFSKVDINNPQRLLRALEVCLSTGKPYSSFRKKETKKRDFNIISIGLNLDRDVLYQRINQRVDDMVKKGLEQEAKSLFPYRHLNALQTVGYEEWFQHFEGKMNKEEAIEKIKQNSRNYAKRQLTWFRKEKNIRWFIAYEIDKAIAWIKEQLS